MVREVPFFLAIVACAATHIQFSRERGRSKNDVNLASEPIKYQSEGVNNAVFVNREAWLC